MPGKVSSAASEFRGDRHGKNLEADSCRHTLYYWRDSWCVLRHRSSRVAFPVHLGRARYAWKTTANGTAGVIKQVSHILSHMGDIGDNRCRNGCRWWCVCLKKKNLGTGARRVYLHTHWSLGSFRYPHPLHDALDAPFRDSRDTRYYIRCQGEVRIQVKPEGAAAADL